MRAVECAAASKGDAQTAARESLNILKGNGVDDALLDEMNKQKVNFVSVSNPQPEAPAAAEAPAKAAQDTKAAEKPAEKPAPAAEKPAAEKAAPAEAKAK